MWYVVLRLRRVLKVVLWVVQRANRRLKARCVQIVGKRTVLRTLALAVLVHCNAAACPRFTAALSRNVADVVDLSLPTTAVQVGYMS